MEEKLQRVQNLVYQVYLVYWKQVIDKPFPILIKMIKAVMQTS